MNTSMKRNLTIAALLLISPDTLPAEEPITWLVQYEGKSLPQEQG